MTRDELVDAGAAALVRDGLDALFGTSAQVMSARVVETVEPLIRADERKRLKAQIETLRDREPDPWYWTDVVDDMFALIDGGGDG